MSESPFGESLTTALGSLDLTAGKLAGMRKYDVVDVVVAVVDDDDDVVVDE